MLLGHHLFHYGMAGAFTYAYARVLGVDRFPAMMASIAFVFSGFMIAHFNHWTFIDTVVWLPAILACIVRADQTGRALVGGPRRAPPSAWRSWPGAPQFAMYNAFAVSGLALALVGRRVSAGHPWWRFSPWRASSSPSWRWAWRLYSFSRRGPWPPDSYRAGLGFEWKAQGSLPLSAMFQLGLPDAIQPLTVWLNDETYFYPGVFPAILAGYALTFRWDWRVGFHAALGLGALLLAFGDRFVLYRLAFDLIPGVALFRIPARILILFNCAVAILAGLGAHAFLSGRGAQLVSDALLGWITGLVAAAAPAMYLLLLWSANGVLEDAATILVDQYVLLLLVLVLVPSRRSPGRRGATRRGSSAPRILVALVLDLVLGSLPIDGTRSHPGQESESERELAAFLAAEPGSGLG